MGYKIFYLQIINYVNPFITLCILLSIANSISNIYHEEGKTM